MIENHPKRAGRRTHMVSPRGPPHPPGLVAPVVGTRMFIFAHYSHISTSVLPSNGFPALPAPRVGALSARHAPANRSGRCSVVDVRGGGRLMVLPVGSLHEHLGHKLSFSGIAVWHPLSGASYVLYRPPTVCRGIRHILHSLRHRPHCLESS